jgi:ABC-type phosphate/phosphonate transport system substrate-binding protein
MKKLLVVLGLSVMALAGKCGSSEDKSSEAAKTQEDFPVKEDSQVPAEEVPSYEQQEEAQPADATATPAPAEAAPATEAPKAP